MEQKKLLSQQEILKARAIENSANDNSSQVIVKKPITIIKFALLSHIYAFETKYISEVLLNKKITPIPGTPPFVWGVINLRGKIVSAINLQTFFKMGDKGLTDQNHLIVLSTQEMFFGVICDKVFGIFTEDESLSQAPPSTLNENYLKYISGILPDNSILLNAHKILTSSEIIITKQ